MTQDQYTGAQATMSYAGSTIAVSEVDIAISRGMATAARMGKWSDYKVPGKLDFKGTVKRIQVDGQFLAALFTGTPTTGSAGTLQAAATWTAGTALTIGANPATPSRVKIVLSVSAITTGGYVIVYGTDVNDGPLTETFTIANGSISGTSWTGTNIFKTTTYALPVTVASTGNGKFEFDSVTGDSSADLGEPKYWNLIARVDDGSNNIVITANNCFFTKGSFKYSDADKMGLDELTFDMRDPDTDLTISYVNS